MQYAGRNEIPTCILHLQKTVWYAGRKQIPTCIPDGHLHRVTYIRCRIDTINSPDDGHMVARNV